MTREEAASCINTIVILKNLCYRVRGLMDVIDAQNCDKIIEMLNTVGETHKKHTETHACDTISRQDTITEIKNYERDSTAPIDYVKIVEQMPPAQPERIQNNAVHLCDSCQYTYVTCPSRGNDAVFGDGKGNDNICACNKYRPIFAQPERKKGKWIPVTKIYKVTEDQFPKTHIEWVDATEPDEIDAVRCSECGEVFDFQDARNWCTECGADMRGLE